MLVDRASSRAIRASGLRWAAAPLTGSNSTSTTRSLHHSAALSANSSKTRSHQNAATTSSTSSSSGTSRPLTLLRHASSSSSSPSLSQSSSFSSRSASSAPATASASSSTRQGLSWNQFLQLRQTRRRYNLFASAFTGMGTAFTGAGYLATMDLNQLSGVLFGIDPIFALGISTVACGALGWLIGPTAGSAVFNMVHKSSGPEMMAKEKSFYHRIQKYRADISAGGNLQNTPFPDYYGEKIDSVAGYRQWLRDQRKFAKKREYRG